MSMTDNVADMLTRVRNGQKSKLMSVAIPHSRMKCAILDVLKEEGYVGEYKVTYEGNKGTIEVDLKYSATGKPVISEIQRVSKPGKRIYSAIDQLRGFCNNMGIYILSTSKGIISDRTAYNLKVGGEVICKVF